MLAWARQATGASASPALHINGGGTATREEAERDYLPAIAFGRVSTGCRLNRGSGPCLAWLIASANLVRGRC